jgi:hypothetical protein
VKSANVVEKTPSATASGSSVGGNALNALGAGIDKPLHIACFLVRFDRGTTRPMGRPTMTPGSRHQWRLVSQTSGKMELPELGDWG